MASNLVSQQPLPVVGRINGAFGEGTVSDRTAPEWFARFRKALENGGVHKGSMDSRFFSAGGGWPDFKHSKNANRKRHNFPDDLAALCDSTKLGDATPLYETIG
ncbi:unnamed protein product [Heligmosomoides polygyrus]|uniref:HTH_48 domain-containing protein n=1 Tax=Heligmosomoides polygyrus TaxID=6339 RepID=A0A183GHK5_HELPZ|nr:unnamed protein product [Heligmosomoides polygyrus]